MQVEMYPLLKLKLGLGFVHLEVGVRAGSKQADGGGMRGNPCGGPRQEPEDSSGCTGKQRHTVTVEEESALA